MKAIKLLSKQFSFVFKQFNHGKCFTSIVLPLLNYWDHKLKVTGWFKHTKKLGAILGQTDLFGKNRKNLTCKNFLWATSVQKSDSTPWKHIRYLKIYYACESALKIKLLLRSHFYLLKLINLNLPVYGTDFISLAVVWGNFISLRNLLRQHNEWVPAEFQKILFAAFPVNRQQLKISNTFVCRNHTNHTNHGTYRKFRGRRSFLQ